MQNFVALFFRSWQNVFHIQNKLYMYIISTIKGKTMSKNLVLSVRLTDAIKDTLEALRIKLGFDSSTDVVKSLLEEKAIELDEVKQIWVDGYLSKLENNENLSLNEWAQVFEYIQAAYSESKVHIFTKDYYLAIVKAFLTIVDECRANMYDFAYLLHAHDKALSYRDTTHFYEFCKKIGNRDYHSGISQLCDSFKRFLITNKALDIDYNKYMPREVIIKLLKYHLHTNLLRDFKYTSIKAARDLTTLQSKIQIELSNRYKSNTNIVGDGFELEVRFTGNTIYFILNYHKNQMTFYYGLPHWRVFLDGLYNVGGDDKIGIYSSNEHNQVFYICGRDFVRCDGLSMAFVTELDKLRAFIQQVLDAPIYNDYLSAYHQLYGDI